jgi:hypothetical protein
MIKPKRSAIAESQAAPEFQENLMRQAERLTREAGLKERGNDGARTPRDRTVERGGR